MEIEIALHTPHGPCHATSRRMVNVPFTLHEDCEEEKEEPLSHDWELVFNHFGQGQPLTANSAAEVRAS